MAAQSTKLFDLMDHEHEPTDEQLEKLMGFVVEAVRARHAQAQDGEQSPKKNISAAGESRH